MLKLKTNKPKGTKKSLGNIFAAIAQMIAGEKGGIEGKRICFNCAYCSEWYPSFVDVCDRDDHVIRDVFTEGCAEFEELGE